METHLTPERLAEIKAYCEKATEGPWLYRHVHNPSEETPSLYTDAIMYELSGPHPITTSGPFLSGNDFDFIAQARTDLPAAVEEIERLRTEVAEWTEATTRERSQRINYSTRIDMLTDELTTAQSELTELRREVERLKVENGKLITEVHGKYGVKHLTDQLLTLTAERDKLAKVLQWYADGNHFEEDTEWNCAKMGELPPPPNLLDRGEVAQTALATLSEGEK